MPKFIRNDKSGVVPEALKADIAMTAQENFVKGVYSLVDAAAANRLEQLRNEHGIVSTCTLGCCHCCRNHILMNTAEAHTLSQYIKREFSVEHMKNLRMRTQQWHEWDNSRPSRSPSVNVGQRTDLSDYDHCCPLLENGECAAYPVRPVVCRTHFVCSDPLACLAANDPESVEKVAVVLTSVVTATSPFSTAIKDHIQTAGLDYSRSIMLLPHWLAVEMDWEFAISL
jgi:Fe-S-cluster containining protein